MKKRICTMCLFCTAIFGIATVSAHHSSAIYDTQREISIEGVVSQIQWRNPHVYIYLEEAKGSGQVLQWQIEGIGPSGFRRAGWSKDTLQVGDQLSVVGNPSRNIERGSLLLQSMHRMGIKLFDATEYFTLVLKADDVAGSVTSTLDGNWATQLNFELLMSQFTDEATYNSLTKAGELAVAQFEEKTMNPGANCEQIATPFSMIIPDVKQITIKKDTVLITGDYDGAERIIHMNLESHDGVTASQQGHSIGHWDGGTLVVDTTHFNESRLGNGWGLPSGAKKHMLEYLTLNTDGQSLTYSFELTDPDYMTAPLIGSTVWKFGPNLNFAVDECDLQAARKFLEN